jgi:hypothetical protein
MTTASINLILVPTEISWNNHSKDVLHGCMHLVAVKISSFLCLNTVQRKWHRDVEVSFRTTYTSMVYDGKGPRNIPFL